MKNHMLHTTSSIDHPASPFDVSNLIAKLDNIESLHIQDSVTSSVFTRVSESITSLEEMSRCCNEDDDDYHKFMKTKRTIFTSYWDKTGEVPVKPRSGYYDDAPSPPALLRRQHAIADGLNCHKAITKVNLRDDCTHHHQNVVRFDPKVEVTLFEPPREQWQDPGWENIFN